MRYYSTQGRAPIATLEKAVVKGLAEDRGLYMPESITPLPKEFFEQMPEMSFQQIACQVAQAFFGEDVEAEALKQIVCDTLSFETPIVKVKENIYSLELFHGPTLAFKDVGARFMARLLQYFIKASDKPKGATVNVLVATSGDTGSAVANGFLGVEGIHVYVLYPKGKVSKIQESQFATLGRNITAIEVDGVFDDCQALVSGEQREFVVCVPSGNFGNICAALFGHQMGLPVKRFIAANNANDIFYQYLLTGQYSPRASQQTLANAMDVGDPSNFARIIDLYSKHQQLSPAETHQRITSLISGATYSDDEIRDIIRRCYAETGYVLDPHGACGYQAIEDQLKPGETGIFCETAHPAKFKETVDSVLGIDLPIPERLANFMKGKKQSIPMSKDFADFKQFLLNQ